MKVCRFKNEEVGGESLKDSSSKNEVEKTVAASGKSFYQEQKEAFTAEQLRSKLRDSSYINKEDEVTLAASGSIENLRRSLLLYIEGASLGAPP